MAIMQAAAPEVVHAAESSSPVVTADTATDIWALGVVAYELLTSSHVFPVGTPQEAIRNAIFGIEAMPWEEASDNEEISPLQVTLPTCYHLRDAC
jgi:serine/threonine protein kinase